MKIVLIVFIFTQILFSKELEKIQLQLQWKHQFESVGFYMAKEKGFYEDVGLDVEFLEFDTGIHIINKVLQTPNMYGITYSNIISEYLKGKPIVFIANFLKQSPLAIVASKDIKQPSDLIGKKVMGVGNNINSAIVLIMFKKFGIEKNDFIHIQPTFNIDAFVNKEIDAMTVYTTNETFFLDKLGIEYNLLNPTIYGAEFYDVNLFTSQNEVKLHHGRTLRFKNASIKGWEYALKNQKEAIEVIMKKHNTQNKSLESLEYEAKQIEDIMLPNLYPIGSININRVKLMIDDFVNLGLVQKNRNINLNNFIFKEKKYNLQLTRKELITLIILFLIVSIAIIVIVNRKLKQKIKNEILKNKEQESLIHYYSKQESMKNMLGNISHQWRHPLNELSSTIMLLDTKLLLDHKITTNDIRDMTTNSKNIINFMSKTIDTFNNFYKKALDDEKNRFYIKNAIDETLFILKGSFEVNNISVKLDIDEKLQLFGTINQFEQVILAILVNAQKIFIKRDIKQREITISAYITQDYIFIDIKDNGGGIKINNINNIFNLSISEEGTGLGLFISRNIIETKFEGKLIVLNQNNGATFRIRLKLI